ncbi:hypothetical protein OsJ_30540 [Oryza sativa Japonica Group]|uniref:DUF7769 domain-containing protein n=1 Tax=Oryza sativa subsp. japonica TaxID=39947 RepID=B9G794_ORYSJ|nr:hypothetical protein OsJ_30540 [Oryza sativa Japonica Group]
MAKDGDGEFAFDLNEPPLEHGNGFDLNLPLNEFGVVDFDYVQHLAEHVVAPIEVNHRRKDMTEEVRKQVYQALLARSKNGKLGKKDTRVVADQFGLHIRAVQRLWKRGKIPLANFIPVDLGSRKKGRVGRKAIPVDLEQLRNIPIKDRMTIEDVCSKLNMSKWRIQRYLKKARSRTRRGRKSWHRLCIPRGRDRSESTATVTSAHDSMLGGPHGRDGSERIEKRPAARNPAPSPSPAAKSPAPSPSPAPSLRLAVPNSDEAKSGGSNISESGNTSDKTSATSIFESGTTSMALRA